MPARARHPGSASSSFKKAPFGPSSRKHRELDHRARTPLDGPRPDVAVEVGGDVPRRHTVDAKVPVRGAPRARVRSMLGHYQHYGLGRGIDDNRVRLTELRRGIAGERQRRPGASEGPIRALGYGRQLTRLFVSC